MKIFLLKIRNYYCRIENNINYIWANYKGSDRFNKCLAYNMGAFFSNKSKYCLFHDIDCLIQSDFFIKLEENIKNQNCQAIQCPNVKVV